MDIHLRKNLEEYFSSNGDRFLGLSFAQDDWENFFSGVLTLPNSWFFEKANPEFDLPEKIKQEVSVITAEFPLLTRIEDYYEDVYYSPEEIGRLHAECASLKQKATDLNLTEFLHTITLASEEAKKHKTGLWLAAD